MNRIKIGQIGVSHEHAPKISSLRRLPEVFEVVGVVDDSASSAAKFPSGDMTPYEGLSWMTEDELLDFPGLQAVMIETPNLDLVPAALRCMERGLAMHMDKPGGDDLALFGKLLEGCKARRLPFQIGYMFRNNPAVQWTREALRQGWLGEVFEIHADMSHNYGGDIYQEYLGRLPGGIMFNLGCHHIDLIVAILGRPRQVTPFLGSAPGFPDRIQNNCLAVLEYPHALAVVSACSQTAEGGGRRRFRLCGTNGSVEWSPLERFDGEPLQMSLVLRESIPGYAAGAHTLAFGPVRDRYEDQLLELAGIIRGEMENPYTYEHDYLVQEVLLAASGCAPWTVAGA